MTDAMPENILTSHDCEEHAEVVDVEAPCPACPDGMWRSADLVCGLCGACVQASGHVHPMQNPNGDPDMWLARGGRFGSQLDEHPALPQ